MGGIPKNLRQADKSRTKPKVPPVGADDNSKTRQAGRETAPKLPERDGPAKDKAGGKDAGKPDTSAKAKQMAGMKSMLAKVK